MISMNVPIIDAMEMCGSENIKDKMVFQRWAELAEKEIGSRYQFIKKIAVLDIHNCTACLPADAYSVQRALIGDFGCDCTDLFNRWCGVVSQEALSAASAGSFLVVDVGTGDDFSVWWNNIVENEIQDNKIVFYQNLDGRKVTVQYLAYKTDCDGFLEVNENHVLAITAFICMRYYMRKKRKSNDDFAMMNKYETEWHRECGNSRAKDSVLTESQRANIVGMLHDPFVGIGIPTVSNPIGDLYW